MGRHGKKIDYALYLVTDRNLMKSDSIEEAVREAIAGGATLVQLREKAASSRDFFEIARSVKKITDSFGVPLIINDRVDIALAARAAGVHVGQEDLPAAIVRKLMGDGAIVGVSASSVQEALAAVHDGADYLGVGAIFPTGTKTDADVVTIETLKNIRSAVDVPIVAIGGIGEKNVNVFEGIGIDGIAVVSAILCRDDVKQAAADLRAAFAKIRTDRR